MKKNQNISIPTDFRKRFAQRDLEISQNEQEYLASKRAQKNISDKAKTKP